MSCCSLPAQWQLGTHSPLCLNAARDLLAASCECIDADQLLCCNSYTNLVALALFGVSRGVDVDLAVLQPCTRLTSLTLKSCRNISCIPPLPCLTSFTVVSYGDLCMHFPPEGLPELQDLRLYGTKLTRCLLPVPCACCCLSAFISELAHLSRLVSRSDIWNISELRTWGRDISAAGLALDQVV